MGPSTVWMQPFILWNFWHSFGLSQLVPSWRQSRGQLRPGNTLCGQFEEGLRDLSCTDMCLSVPFVFAAGRAAPGGSIYHYKCSQWQQGWREFQEGGGLVGNCCTRETWCTPRSTKPIAALRLKYQAPFWERKNPGNSGTLLVQSWRRFEKGSGSPAQRINSVSVSSSGLRHFQPQL